MILNLWGFPRRVGDCQTIKLEQARAMATAWIEQFENRAEDELVGIKLERFADRYLNDCKWRWKPATVSGHWYGLKRFLPELGHKTIAEITPKSVR